MNARVGEKCIRKNGLSMNRNSFNLRICRLCLQHNYTMVIIYAKDETAVARSDMLSLFIVDKTA